MNTSSHLLIEKLQTLGTFTPEHLTTIQKQSAVINKLTHLANEKIERYHQLPTNTPETMAEGLDIQALQIQTLHEKTTLLHDLVEDLYRRQGELLTLLESTLNR